MSKITGNLAFKYLEYSGGPFLSAAFVFGMFLATTHVGAVEYAI